MHYFVSFYVVINDVTFIKLLYVRTNKRRSSSKTNSNMTPKSKTITWVITFVVLSGAFFVTEGIDDNVHCFDIVRKECLDVFYKQICLDDSAPVNMGDCCGDIYEISPDCYSFALVKQAVNLHLCDDKPSFRVRGSVIYEACFGYA